MRRSQVAAIVESLHKLNRYPDGSAFYLKQALSRKFGIPPQQILLGNGSNEIIELAVRTFLSPGDKALQPFPTFLIYQKMVSAQGGEMVSVPLNGYRIDLDRLLSTVDPATKLIFLSNPNNPTGTALSHKELEDFLKALCKGVIVLLDEAYIEFAHDPNIAQGLQLLEYFENLIVFRTFSKLYGLAGLRIGYGFASPILADYMNRVRQPFNVNLLAQQAALAALEDEGFVFKTKKLIREEKKRLYEEIERLGLEYVPSETNFFLIKVKGHADQVYSEMLRRGVIIRSMASFGLGDHIRVTVGLKEENDKFLSALKGVLGYC